MNMFNNLSYYIYFLINEHQSLIDLYILKRWLITSAWAIFIIIMRKKILICDFVFINFQDNYVDLQHNRVNIHAS